MTYRQITPEERYTLATLRKQGLSNAKIARMLGRHRSTVGRELRRNTTHSDGSYRYSRAQEAANGRRSRSRRNSHFTREHWRMIEDLLRADLSPEQVSGVLARDGLLHISHETIYQHVWRDKRNGGDLWHRLRQRPKYRKRYGTREKRGRLAGKRHISERPAAVERRRQAGHWEMDTVSGSGSKHCIVTLVERATAAFNMPHDSEPAADAFPKAASELRRPFGRLPNPQSTSRRRCQRRRRVRGSDLAVIVFAVPSLRGPHFPAAPMFRSAATTRLISASSAQCEEAEHVPEYSCGDDSSNAPTYRTWVNNARHKIYDDHDYHDRRRNHTEGHDRSCATTLRRHVWS